MIRVAGVGPGHPKYLTQEVRDLIKSSFRVLAFSRVAEGLSNLNPNIEKISGYKSLLELKEEDQVLILASGDPLFFGIVDYLKRNKIPIESVHMGLSSIQYLAAKLIIPWQDCSVMSVHGRSMNECTINKNKFFLLTDKINTPHRVSQYLKEMGYEGNLYLGQNLSYEDEVIKKYRIGQDIEEEGLVVLYIEVENDIS